MESGILIWATNEIEILFTEMRQSWQRADFKESEEVCWIIGGGGTEPCLLMVSAGWWPDPCGSVATLVHRGDQPLLVL